ncbi:MAG: NUDIX domain-containing protein [Candidatus Liptonbacteria bacterium]|nr:NUDIX domain-containing protein [Candidatus Liptonbacteria bacterium]
MRDRKFKPKPGQIDYSDARWAPVINCVVKYGDKILIVKRSSELRFYPGLWNGLGGFLDDDRGLEEKVREELQEEIGIGSDDIVSIKSGEIFDADDPEFGKTWIIHPILVEVRTDKVVLDWEAEEYRWIKPEELADFKIADSFKKVVKNFFDL